MKNSHQSIIGNLLNLFKNEKKLSNVVLLVIITFVLMLVTAVITVYSCSSDTEEQANTENIPTDKPSRLG